jgi:hypothetical protein
MASDWRPARIPHPADGEAPSGVAERVIRKLSPETIGYREDGKMAAMVAYLLNQHGWTDPEILWMAVDSQGMLSTDRVFVGPVAQLDRNLRELADLAGLDRTERAWLLHRRDICVDDHRLGLG